MESCVCGNTFDLHVNYLPKRDLDRLQSVINAAARLTTGARRYDHGKLLLKDLGLYTMVVRT